MKVAMKYNTIFDILMMFSMSFVMLVMIIRICFFFFLIFCLPIFYYNLLTWSTQIDRNTNLKCLFKFFYIVTSNV
jgi:hypothetical protein